MAKKAKIPENVFLNLETYGGGANSVTNCCGRGVRVTIKYQFNLDKVAPDTRVDDWGKRLKA